MSLPRYCTTGLPCECSICPTSISSRRATSANEQTESQMTGVGGGFVGIGVGASSTDSGSAMARMNGTVTSGQSLTLTANSLDNAGSTSYGFSGGVVTVDAASADAEASPTVNAAIGGGATLSGPVIVQATTDKSVTATVKGGAVGGVAIAGMMASPMRAARPRLRSMAASRPVRLVLATSTVNDPTIANDAGAT